MKANENDCRDYTCIDKDSRKQILLVRFGWVLLGMVALVIGAALIFISGWVYSWVALGGLGKVPLLLPLLYTVAPGYIGAYVWRCFNLKNVGLELIVLILMSLVAVYGSWVWFVYLLSNGQLFFSPCDLYHLALQIADAREVVICATPISGGTLKFLYVVEAMIILSVGVLVGAGKHRQYLETRQG